MKSSLQIALDVLLAIPDDAAWEEVAAQLSRARSLVLAHASNLIIREIWQSTGRADGGVTDARTESPETSSPRGA